MEKIDCRGMPCPEPVIRAKRALDLLPQGCSVVLEVDAPAARENVCRFLRSRGAGAAVEEVPGPAWRITITAPPADQVDRARGDAPRAMRPPVVFIASDRLGEGDDKLGGILLEGFIKALAEQDTVPDALLLMNGGVRLAVEGSPVLPALRILADRGCQILACGTCLDFFGVKDRIAAGRISNMLEIQGKLLEASSVLRP